ncbi:MAG: 50S ribosomal protein L1 [Candidatus Eremiobacteraeota bacterium]|nr:50S ribosomal protein L1 [Candidatus Eremiobacteraeota bacterium]
MAVRSKKYKESLSKVDRMKLYDLEEAIELVKKTARAKFDETIETSIRLGIDPRRSDQNVRGTVVLPHGTGKTPTVIVFTKGEKVGIAIEAGADEAGADELVERVKEGWMDWDIAAATPDAMGIVGKNLGRILGPKMPSPKSGTVNLDVATMVKELKSGKVQYRADKTGIVHTPVGRISFDSEKIFENLKVLLDAVMRAKPAASKGTYLKSIVLSSTMGPGIKIDPTKAALAIKEK